MRLEPGVLLPTALSWDVHLVRVTTKELSVTESALAGTCREQVGAE